MSAFWPCAEGIKPGRGFAGGRAVASTDGFIKQAGRGFFSLMVFQAEKPPHHMDVITVTQSVARLCSYIDERRQVRLSALEGGNETGAFVAGRLAVGIQFLYLYFKY